VSTILTVAIYGGIYLLLAGSLSVSEGFTAALLGIAATAWAAAVRHKTQRRFSWPMDASTLWKRIPRVSARGTFRATGVLLRAALGADARGIPLHIEFHSGRNDSPRDRSRRAAALLAASLAPDAFVIRLDHGRAALIHDIVGGQERDHDPNWLI